MSFGHIEGISVGTHFEWRVSLSKAKIHPPIYQGVSGDVNTGACSIVISDGYEDNEDNGTSIEYTAAGGQEDYFKVGRSKHQIRDQSWGPCQKKLHKSFETKKPIRVIRGSKLGTKYAPYSGYRYDGLYYVTQVYATLGRSGFLVWKFHLERLEGQPDIPTRYCPEIVPVKKFNGWL